MPHHKRRRRNAAFDELTELLGPPPEVYLKSTDWSPSSEPTEPKPSDSLPVVDFDGSDEALERWQITFGPGYPARYELRGAQRREPGDPPGGVFDDSLDGLVQSVAHNLGMVWHVLDTKTGEVVAHSDGWGQIEKPPPTEADEGG